MSNITARGTFNGQELRDVQVVNPGNWFGKTWLIEIGGSFWPLYLVVEADSVQDVLDELSESETHGHHIVVAEEDLGDYPEDERHYGPSGQVLDTEHIMIYGQEGAKSPWPCTYHGDGLPSEGMTPTDYLYRDEEA